ncbi:hypothetical protein BDQ17DRAFT_1313714 [Cyathus striatus]|nr:hypothetical protein BDQ17DRAFT_1313714 [Cyathus striatus]
MQLLSLLALTALPIAFAQRVFISSPADGATVSRGQSVVVEVDRPNFLSSAEEVAVVLGLQYCTPTCRPPTDIMGTILYNGPYNPQYSSPTDAKPPHQNFTIVIPQSATVGNAQLGLAHFQLLGAGLAPFSETLNITLNIN